MFFEFEEEKASEIDFAKDALNTFSAWKGSNKRVTEIKETSNSESQNIQVNLEKINISKNTSKNEFKPKWTNQPPVKSLLPPPKLLGNPKRIGESSTQKESITPKQRESISLKSKESIITPKQTAITPKSYDSIITQNPDLKEPKLDSKDTIQKKFTQTPKLPTIKPTKIETPQKIIKNHKVAPTVAQKKPAVVVMAESAPDIFNYKDNVLTEIESIKKSIHSVKDMCSNAITMIDGKKNKRILCQLFMVDLVNQCPSLGRILRGFHWSNGHLDTRINYETLKERLVQFMQTFDEKMIIPTDSKPSNFVGSNKINADVMDLDNSQLELFFSE